jgi:hypothetical protein
VFGGFASVLVGEAIGLASLAATAIRAAVSIGFLRLATLALAQAFDLVTFSLIVARHGATAEANPIVSSLFDAYGMPAVTLAKLALVLLVGALAVAASSQNRRRGRIWSVAGGLPLALAIAAGLVGGITNAAAYLG